MQKILYIFAQITCHSSICYHVHTLLRKKYIICLLMENPGEFFLFFVSLTALIEQDKKGENV